jgi:hydrogenase small subunit
VELTRRDFIKAASAIAAAMGLTSLGLPRMRRAEAVEGGPKVIWFQGQACTGCSVSLLNSMYYLTADSLLLDTLDLRYHPNLMASAGDRAVTAAEAVRAEGGHVLVVEGAVPSKSSKKADFCTIWPEMPIKDAVEMYAQEAAMVLAVGTCAAYGGIPGAKKNPTKAVSVESIVGGSAPVVNLPGCPAHPDWVIGTVAYILQNGRAPSLDALGRPRTYFGSTVHEHCPRREHYEEHEFASSLGQDGCLYYLGCKGPMTSADCPTRKWNGEFASTQGVSWCVGAGSPCLGCTEPGFPDAMSPFLVPGHDGISGPTAPIGGGDDDDDDDD